MVTIVPPQDLHIDKKLNNIALVVFARIGQIRVYHR